MVVAFGVDDDAVRGHQEVSGAIPLDLVLRVVGVHVELTVILREHGHARGLVGGGLQLLVLLHQLGVRERVHQGLEAEHVEEGDGPFHARICSVTAGLEAEEVVERRLPARQEPRSTVIRMPRSAVPTMDLPTVDLQGDRKALDPGV